MARISEQFARVLKLAAMVPVALLLIGCSKHTTQMTSVKVYEDGITKSFEFQSIANGDTTTHFVLYDENGEITTNMSDSMMLVHKKALKAHNKALKAQEKALETHHKALEVHNQALEVHKDNMKRHDSLIKLHNGLIKKHLNN